MSDETAFVLYTAVFGCLTCTLYARKGGMGEGPVGPVGLIISVAGLGALQVIASVLWLWWTPSTLYFAELEHPWQLAGVIAAWWVSMGLLWVRHLQRWLATRSSASSDPVDGASLG